MVEDRIVAAVAGVVVTASFPFYIYGAWIVLDAETVTWERLVYHLKFVTTGLVLTTVPVVGWMIPRLAGQLTGAAVVHAFFALQAYALLVFALTGIYRIFQAKLEADLYRDPDPDIALDDLDENMGHWRARLRVGVAGYTVLWMVAWITGVYQFYVLYLV